MVLKEPGLLTATLTRYPPQGGYYRPEKSIQLVDPADPDTVIVKIDRLTVMAVGI